ncbi:hypothetical protein FHS18_003939 [Paenibacillus phyllosphaerae]|uniref:DUF6199 domain-containing protein n=1 Tax=Paenibacillus phyllosphaerae TaxID=274593 RepID=A0A7W5B0X4_9BACL|nr:DUF6199 family natural product biosynthesis protein [Paenibacillus phyllosphaerae]MBB3111871.1 hypothetical protein [Paenibacillus phyllosphaerae]
MKFVKKVGNAVIVLYVLLVLFGLLLMVKPAVFWAISESWKSNDGTEPSDLYLWSTRFGGFMCSVVGIGAIIAVSL